jgi:hypothetical protein
MRTRNGEPCCHFGRRCAPIKCLFRIPVAAPSSAASASPRRRPAGACLGHRPPHSQPSQRLQPHCLVLLGPDLLPSDTGRIRDHQQRGVHNRACRTRRYYYLCAVHPAVPRALQTQECVTLCQTYVDPNYVPITVAGDLRRQLQQRSQWLTQGGNLVWYVAGEKCMS